MFRSILLTLLVPFAFIKSVIAQKIIYGNVTSKKDSTPVNGAKITVPKGDEDIYTYTDEKGNFIMKVFDDSDVAIFSNYYFENDTVSLDNNEINLEMIPKEIVYFNYADYYNSGYYYSYVNYYNYSYSDYSNYYNYYYSDYYNYYNYYYTDYYDYYDYAANVKPVNEEIKSGSLTAGEVNDFTKWEMWQDISKGVLFQYQNDWMLQTENRFCVQLTNNADLPVIDADVKLFKNDSLVWTSKTDNTGKAELWGNMFVEVDALTKEYKIVVNYDLIEYQISNPTFFNKGINTLKLDAQCSIPKNVDIAFIIDKTGSMSDEIDYLKVEVNDIIKYIGKDKKNLTFNFASAIYAVYDYPIEKCDFTTNIKNIQEFISEQQIHPGGDENVDEAIGFGVDSLNWSENSVARIMFLILDEPPSISAEHLANLKKVIIDASKKGIRVVPILCSGADKSLEFLLRSIALATNGTYLFLTDDSGIGNSHITPTTDEYDVETLNDLIVRIVNKFSENNSCKDKIEYDKNEIKDTCLVVINEDVVINEIEIDINNQNDIDSTEIEDDIELNEDVEEVKSLKIYPNPTTGILTVELEGELAELFLADYSEKILERYVIEGEEKIKINLSQYPNGFYFLQYFYKDTWKSGKIILLR